MSKLQFVVMSVDVISGLAGLIEFGTNGLHFVIQTYLFRISFQTFQQSRSFVCKFGVFHGANLVKYGASLRLCSQFLPAHAQAAKIPEMV